MRLSKKKKKNGRSQSPYITKAVLGILLTIVLNEIWEFTTKREILCPNFTQKDVILKLMRKVFLLIYLVVSHNLINIHFAHKDSLFKKW